MYLEKKRLANGRYRYLVPCPKCKDTRWIADIRASRCMKCKKTRELAFVEFGQAIVNIVE